MNFANLIKGVFTDLYCLIKTIGIIILQNCCIHSEYTVIRNTNTYPIILLHGSGAHRAEFYDTIKMLKNKYNGSIIALTYDSEIYNDNYDGMIRKKIKKINKVHHRKDSIEYYTDIITAKLKFYNFDKVIFVGHSLGGLVAAQYACDNTDKVHAIVTFGTPFQGTPRISQFPFSWYFANSKRYQDMKIGSNFLRNLRLKINGNFPILTIGSPIDFHVPNRYAHLTDSEKIVVDDHMHFALHYCPKTWNKILVWLYDINI